ncbi:MAG TPA: STAS domain-containing protein [Thermoanaerobaculia bacterium]|nr:STAS domain-containing protein [Thermoanaerobaculia bacterium]
MLEISFGANDQIVLSGRFDAGEAEKARQVFLALDRSKVVDFARLDYISSAGLGVLLAAQKKLSESGSGLKLVNMNGHIRDVFRFSGFDQIFEIE